MLTEAFRKRFLNRREFVVYLSFTVDVILSRKAARFDVLAKIKPKLLYKMTIIRVR